MARLGGGKHVLSVCSTLLLATAWLPYPTRLLGGQLNSGEGYESLRPVVGIHIMDFEYFNVQEVIHAANAVSGTDRVNGDQYVWCFALRDRD